MTDGDCHETLCDDIPDVPDDTVDTEAVGTSTTEAQGQVSPIRRSTRTRDPPDRLHSAELGSPLLAMMQSFLRGLSTFVDTALSEDTLCPPCGNCTTFTMPRDGHEVKGGECSLGCVSSKRYN